MSSSLFKNSRSINMDLAEPVTAAIAEDSGKNKAPGRRTPNYTDKQDLLISKAFIRASEDPTVGTSQKVKTFELAIENAYKEVVQEQVRVDLMDYRAASRLERSVERDMGLDLLSSVSGSDDPDDSTVVEAYPARNGVALFRRFRDFIQPTVGKFLGLMNQNLLKSGEDKEVWYKRICILWKKRSGKDFQSRLCLLYLQDKSKFIEFTNNLDRKKNEAAPRPMGKKKATELEKKKAFFEEYAEKAAAKGMNKAPQLAEVGGTRPCRSSFPIDLALVDSGTECVRRQSVAALLQSLLPRRHKRLVSTFRFPGLLHIYDQTALYQDPRTLRHLLQLARTNPPFLLRHSTHGAPPSSCEA